MFFRERFRALAQEGEADALVWTRPAPEEITAGSEDSGLRGETASHSAFNR